MVPAITAPGEEILAGSHQISLHLQISELSITLQTSFFNGSRKICQFSVYPISCCKDSSGNFLLHIGAETKSDVITF